MKGNVIKYEQDNIDTDVILPGTYLKIHDYAELATHAMEGLDPDFHSKVKEGDFIVAGRNFGCGSSREHAPIALTHSGIKAVLALSFARTPICAPQQAPQVGGPTIAPASRNILMNPFSNAFL